MVSRGVSTGVLCLSLALAGAGTGAADGFKVLRKVTLGGEGGWDYLTLDPATHRLFITRGDRVVVLDVDTDKAVGEISKTDGVHGVALAPDLGRGVTSNGKANTATIFDLKTLAPVGSVKTGDKPDAIIYDEASHRVFCFNGKSEDVTVIDPATATVTGTIKLGGAPEFAAADGKGKVFVNLEDKNEVVAIDSKEMAVKARWSLAPCDAPTGLSMDTATRRLFSGCNGSKTLAVSDADKGKVIAALPIGAGVDATAFDPATKLVFSSNADGTLTVIKEESPEKFVVVENAKTAPRARTLALDPKTHKIYLVTAQFGATPSPTPQEPRPRPPMVPGTFEMLVVGQ